MIQCPECRSKEWVKTYFSPVDPAKDQFRCLGCKTEFKRYDKPREAAMDMDFPVSSERDENGSSKCPKCGSGGPHTGIIGENQLFRCRSCRGIFLSEEGKMNELLSECQASFRKYATENAIDLTDSDVWEPLYMAFLAGVEYSTGKFLAQFTELSEMLS